MSDTAKSGDVFGIASYGEAINALAKGAVEGASAFLGRICLPASEELGLLLRDKVSAWRGRNATLILMKAERILNAEPETDGMHAHPRLVGKILDSGSWTDDDEVQNLWAGLLATACTPNGTDESNLIFIHLLEQLTSAQVRILKTACMQAPKAVSLSGWIFARRCEFSLETLMQISGSGDVYRLDRELDHLRVLGLLGPTSGFQVFSTTQDADLTPSALGLQLYARSCGHRGNPKDFFDVTQAEPESFGTS